MSFFNAFIAPSRAANAWFFAGLATSYPNITTSSSTSLSDPLPCEDSSVPGCKVFQVPNNDSSKAIEVDVDDVAVSADLKEQVVVFQFQGQFHAIDHVSKRNKMGEDKKLMQVQMCPHSSYPLSKGTPFDIEDFGVRLSAGIRCPKHDWSFDLFRGNGDRGTYRLKIWEVQLRPVTKDGSTSHSGSQGGDEENEVWVRRKQRIG